LQGGCQRVSQSIGTTAGLGRPVPRVRLLRRQTNRTDSSSQTIFLQTILPCLYVIM
jgi:hypothetical protein